MRSPTIALLWEIWRQHRWTVAVIAGLTIVGRVLYFFETRNGTIDVGSGPSPLVSLLGWIAFLLLFAVFNYTESSDVRGMGQFPRRLFTLPVTSLHLVLVPLLAGITSIELLYLPWVQPLSYGSATTPFVAGLLAALFTFYLSVLWMLERAGVLRLIMIGVVATIVCGLGLLPSFPPSPPPRWRSEGAIAAYVGASAVIAFLLSWRHVARLRAGGAPSARHSASVFSWIAEATPAPRRAFASPGAAHFWFEWRSAGMVLPALVGGVLLLVVMPMSWLARSHAEDTFRLLLATLAAPVVLAIPVGIGFSKPTFASPDLRLPAFVAVRPLSSEELVAIKMKVAAASAALSWTLVAAFVIVWLSSWANLDSLSRLAIQLWAFHGQSRAAVYGIASLVAIVGIVLTWRFLVSRLCSGLSGRRPLFVASVVSIVILVIASLVLDVARLPGWLRDDPARLAPAVWIAAVAVIAKYWIAAYAWRGMPPRYLRAYLMIWLAGTASCMALGLVVWGIVRIYVPFDVERLRSVVVLLALLAIPLARVALAPSLLARNRHR